MSPTNFYSCVWLQDKIHFAVMAGTQKKIHQKWTAKYLIWKVSDDNTRWIWPATIYIVYLNIVYASYKFSIPLCGCRIKYILLLWQAHKPDWVFFFSIIFCDTVIVHKPHHSYNWAIHFPTTKIIGKVGWWCNVYSVCIQLDVSHDVDEMMMCVHCTFW